MVYIYIYLTKMKSSHVTLLSKLLNWGHFSNGSGIHNWDMSTTSNHTHDHQAFQVPKVEESSPM